MIVKSERERAKVKEFLRENYKVIKDVYKYYSSLTGSSEMFSISMNSYKEFLTRTEMIDGKLLKLSEIDLPFTATNKINVKMPFNPERALVRFQLLEIIVRVALEKYIRTKVLTLAEDAVKKIYNDHLKLLSDEFNIKEWRELKLWNQECDKAYKTYMPIIKDIYNQYSGLKLRPG